MSLTRHTCAVSMYATYTAWHTRVDVWQSSLGQWTSGGISRHGRFKMTLARGVGCRARAGARAVPSAKATQDNHDTKYQIRRTARGRGAVVCIYTAMQRRILAILYAIRLGVIFMWSSKHHRLQLQAAGCRLRAAQATHATATATQHPRGKRLPETRGVALHTTHTTQK